jgi:hypothetical protein
VNRKHPKNNQGTFPCRQGLSAADGAIEAVTGRATCQALAVVINFGELAAAPFTLIAGHGALPWQSPYRSGAARHAIVLASSHKALSDADHSDTADSELHNRAGIRQHDQHNVPAGRVSDPRGN